MANIARFGFVIVLGLGLSTGCGSSTSQNTAATEAGTGETPANQPDYSNNPIAQVASEFLDAVLKGDTQRGSAVLTPKAMQQIVATGKQFDPPGVENPRFRIVGIGQPSEDHAFVQCEFNFTAQGTMHTEEMCCELRRVDNNWRVSGIAYGTTPDKPWILSDFETGKDIPIMRQASTNPNAAPAQADGAVGRPSPPRTAQEAPATGLPAERR